MEELGSSKYVDVGNDIANILLVNLEKLSLLEVGLSNMETALEKGNLEEALDNLKNLNLLDDRLQMKLRDFSIQGLPVFHYLARIRFRIEDECVLDKLIKIFIENGEYDIDKRTDKYSARKRASLGFTALFAAVEQSNLSLVVCLLQNGAKTNIRDKSGFYPIHWAIFVGDFKCFEKLIQVGSGSIVLPTDQEDVHPILHTAVDEGRMEMVFYMLNCEGLGLDINEEAIYPGVMSESAFVQFPSRYDSNPEVLETLDTSFTPLARAVRMRKIPIIEMLLKHGAKLSGFSELHFCILEGDTEVACLLLEYFSNDDLCNDKISGHWALQCLHPVAFQDELRVEKTIELICEYLDAGWDVDSVSTAPVFKTVTLDVPANVDLHYSAKKITGFTFLHMACLAKARPEIIKCLVEEGADVNMKTGKDGDVHLYPLQMLFLSRQWENAVYLINEGGVDLNLVGSLTGDTFTSFSRKQTNEMINYIQISGDATEGYKCFNSVELLLALHDPDGEAALNSILQKGFVCHGANELHVAIEGGNPCFVSKILQHSSCELLTNEELTWVIWEPNSPKLSSYKLKISALNWLLGRSLSRPTDMQAAADVINRFVWKGYDLAVAVEHLEGDRNSHWPPLLFHILHLDFVNRTTVLLRTLLQFDVKLNVVYTNNMNPIEYVMDLWDKRCCIENYSCWKIKDELEIYCCEVVKLLVNHGIDAANVRIGENFKYHFGYKTMLQMLFCAGAKITDDFFRSPICHAGYLGTRPFSEEVKQLKDWNAKFDEENKCNLKQICRLEVRKLANGNLKLLDALPKAVKEYVLVQDIYA